MWSFLTKAVDSGRLSSAWAGMLFHCTMGLALCCLVAGCGDFFGDDDDGFDLSFPAVQRFGEGTVAFQVAPGQNEFSVSVGAGLPSGSIPLSHVLVSGDGASLSVSTLGANNPTIDYALPDSIGSDGFDVAVTWDARCLALIVDGERVETTSPGSIIGYADPGSVTGESSVRSLKVFARRMDEEEIEIVQNDGPATLVVSKGIASAEQEERTVCLQLGTGEVDIATTEHDLTWDGTCATLIEGSCAAAASSVSLTTTHESESTLRVNVESTEDGVSLPNGSLYCCSFMADLRDSTGCCPISLENATALDLDESEISVGAVNGGVCHVDGIERTCS